MATAEAGKPTLLLEGLYFGEGPRWHDGRLYFSDFFDYAVKAVDLDGKVEKVVEVPQIPSGLGWLPDGRMLVVSMRDRKVMRLDADGLVEHADLSGIATFDCNDMVVDATGPGLRRELRLRPPHASSTSRGSRARWPSPGPRRPRWPASTRTARCTPRHRT